MGKEALIKAQGEYKKAQGGVAGKDKARMSDEQLDEKRHSRGYNPIDDAEKANISSKLNEDSGRYKKGPGPF